ncbi:DUF47 [Candidatus Magnetomoraceae bacterium gMMP-15]
MFLEKILSFGKKEKKVVTNITSLIKLLCRACSTFKTALENNDPKLMHCVIDLEREGDVIRRKIISNIYDGAFLPYLRPELCRFVEIVDKVFDCIEDTARNYLDVQLPEEIQSECKSVALLNIKICEMLKITFKAMLDGVNLREKSLAIRIYEKKIDDMKFFLLKEIRKLPVIDFWQAKILSDFISDLTIISDYIEDASDHLQVISLIMR